MLHDKLLCLVDDDEIYQFIVRKIIEKKNLPCKLIVFSDGESLLDYLQTHKNEESKLPQAILIDLHMPLMNGWQLIDHYCKIQSGLCLKSNVYVVTSSISEGDRKRAKSYDEVKDFVEKPFDENRLNQIIEEAP